MAFGALEFNMTWPSHRIYGILLLEREERQSISVWKDIPLLSTICLDILLRHSSDYCTSKYLHGCSLSRMYCPSEAWRELCKCFSYLLPYLHQTGKKPWISNSRGLSHQRRGLDSLYTPLSCFGYISSSQFNRNLLRLLPWLSRNLSPSISLSLRFCYSLACACSSVRKKLLARRN